MKLPTEIKTEKMAIKHSILMWYWLWKNPDKNKDEYFLSVGNYPDWHADCTCCEYYSSCSNGCPLSHSDLCLDSEICSAFDNWNNDENKSENAHKIYTALVNYWKEKDWKDKDVEEVI